MKRLSFLVLSLLLLSPAIPSQSTEQEPQTMQAMLVEIRELRRDLQKAANAARRAQIVIYRLHEQVVVVEQARQQLENAKGTLEQIQNQQRYENFQLKRYEEMRDRAENEEARKSFEDSITQAQSQMEMAARGEQEWQSKQMEYDAELRMQKEKLEALEAELERLDKDLDRDAVVTATERKP
jgi:chromosome segregation ATPase